MTLLDMTCEQPTEEAAENLLVDHLLGEDIIGGVTSDDDMQSDIDPDDPPILLIIRKFLDK